MELKKIVLTFSKNSYHKYKKHVHTLSDAYCPSTLFFAASAAACSCLSLLTKSELLWLMAMSRGVSFYIEVGNDLHLFVSTSKNCTLL